MRKRRFRFRLSSLLWATLLVSSLSMLAIYAYRLFEGRDDDKRFYLAGVVLMLITWCVAFILDDLHKRD